MTIGKQSPLPSKATLDEWVSRSQNCKFKNIPPAGDPMVERYEGDDIWRLASHNIKGSTFGTGFEIPYEMDLVRDLGIDCQAFQEINRPWTASNKWQYEMMMREVFQNSKTTYSSGHVKYDQKRLPGGNLLTINGNSTGRVMESGSDKWGRFCWMTIRGGRDEGILVLSAYRVCHKASDNPGAFTAYTNQHSSMRKEGIKNPNPRKRILKDMLTLIEEKRKEGYRPIVVMDANGDYQHEKDRDKDLAKFIKDAQLEDHYIDKFPGQIRTYMFGSKRLDYCFVDPGLVGAIKSIGYLGTHEATYSDHVMVYVDFWESKLFQGKINRPPDLHSREFRIEQKDKVERFLKEFIKNVEAQRIKERVFGLATKFWQYGAQQKHVKEYQILDRQIRECAIAAASKIGQKKYGYMRNPTLTLCGQYLVLTKMLTDCARRRTYPPDSLLKRTKALGLDFEADFQTKNEKDLLKQVHERRKDLWEHQKSSEGERAAWLENEAKARAKAAGDKDWERALDQMVRVAESRSINRKLSAITKGRSGTLSGVEVPLHDWFYSQEKNEIFHYDLGNFESHSSDGKGRYFPHHTLKVLPKDTTQAIVSQDPDGSFSLRTVITAYYSPSTNRIHQHHEDRVEVFQQIEDSRYVLTNTCPMPKDAKAASITRKGDICTLDTVHDIPATMWRELTVPSKVEQSIKERNKRHLQQTAMEGGANSGPIMQELQKNHGISNKVDDLLKGEYTTEYEVDEAMAAWIQQVKQTEREKRAPPIVGVMNKASYQRAFKVATEKTSSNSTWGLHYSLWKAMASSDWCAEFQCIMISLPFMYGFINQRWKKMTDFMLEKKKGNRKIHLLRIIGLLEADFNTILKFFFAVQVQPQAERNGLTDEQWGFRSNRTSIDASWIILLGYENARIMKETFGEMSHDLKAQFDRMDPGQNNIYAQKHNVDKNLLLARGMHIEQLERHVKTANGVSETFYKQLPNEPKIGGEVQGKGDVPPMSTLQTCIMLDAHATIAPGLEMYSCTKHRSIKHHSVAYADDTTGRASVPHNSEFPSEEALAALEKSAQAWSELVDIGGGSLALHKTKYRLIAWEVVKGELVMVKEPEARVMMGDGKGARVEIEYSGPSEPNDGLGFLICPDMNQSPQLESILESIGEICAKVASARLSEKETRQVLQQRIIPKLSYPLNLSCFTAGQCRRINTLIRRAILPTIRLNRNIPHAVAFGDERHGGMGLPEAYTLQDQLQIPQILKHLRWDQTIANDFLVALDNAQLASGFITPIFEGTSIPISYLKHSQLVHIRERMREFRGSMWIEKSWSPKLQRERDESIMERFARIQGITKGQLEKANAVRLYLRVITIADLADENGQYIPDDMVNGQFQAGSDLLWPHQPCPPSRHWAIFRKCLRQTFCTGVERNQRASFSMALDIPLGKWHKVKRNTWWPCYQSCDSLFYRNEMTNKFEVLTQKRQTGFYTFSHDCEHLPDECHPIAIQRIGQKSWTRRPFRLSTTTEKEAKAPGYVVSDTLTSESKPTRIKTCGDGSVYLREQCAAAAWLIATDEEHVLQACFLMSDTNSVSSYRSELEGIFRCLKHIDYLGMEPTEVNQWCDNEKAVESSMEPPTRPTQMLNPDMDIVLAIHHLKSKLSSTKVSCRHVYGHQDDKKKKKKVELKKMKQAKRSKKNGRTRSTNTSKHECESGTSHATTLENDKLSNPKLPQELKEKFGILSSTSDSDSEEEHEQPIRREGEPIKHSDEALMNMACDQVAGETTDAGLKGGKAPDDTVLDLPYEGSRAMFRIGRKWITTKLKGEIYLARRTKPMRAYCKRKYGWSRRTFNSVYWESVRSVRGKITQTKKMQTCKIMHDWLPVGHLRHYITGINQCPGCKCTDETLHHMLSCPHSLMKAKRKEVLSVMKKKGKKKKVPSDIIDAFIKVLRATVENRDVIIRPHYSSEIQLAIKQQEKIGFKMMARGFLAKGWMTALVNAKVPHPERRMNTIQRMIWEDLVDPLWTQRNSILYDEKNKFNLAEDEILTRRIEWFVANKEQVLSYGDHFMANQDVTRLHKMTRRTKREWIHHLEIAKKAFKADMDSREVGQSVLTKYFCLAQTPDTTDPATAPPPPLPGERGEHVSLIS